MQIKSKHWKKDETPRLKLWTILCLLAPAVNGFGELNFDLTIYSLTNHNTSAYSNYTQSTHGANFGTTSWADTVGDTITINPARMDESLNPITPGHVSHTDVHTLIPRRPDLRWFANGTCWFGESSHINIGVNNNTTAYVASMINDLESRGFNGLIFSWYGKGDQTDSVAQKVKAYLASSSNTNKNFKYIIMVVFGDFKGGESVSNLQANINYCVTNYFNDPNYETEPVAHGNPILMFFNVRSSTYMSAADMETIKAATDPNAIWVDEHDGHITEPWVNMTYQWTDCYDQGNTNELAGTSPYNLNTITNEYPTLKANSSKQAFGAMCAHFNGTLTKSVAWSLGKYLPSGNGLCEVERAAEINLMIPTNMTRMQWATWSDWEEGTEVESGTENYFTLAPQMRSSNVLSWTIASGDERTVDHYEIYAVTNNGNAALLCSIPTGIYQTNISSLELLPGIYQLYIDAIGKPCIRDHMSAPVLFAISETPLITSDLQPLLQIVGQGSPLSFTVGATGQPPLSYQWTLNGQAIAGATNAMYAFNALAETNYYAVTITNSLSSSTSSTAEVVGVVPKYLTATNSYYQMRITFSGYTNAAVLQNFPVLIRLNPTNLPGFSYSQFISPATGADLRFTDADQLELPFEIDQWNPAGESEVWVKMSSLATTNDYINAYWGNPTDCGLLPCNTNGTTWTTLNGTNNYLLVYHLSQSGFPYLDSALDSPSVNGLAPRLTNGIVGSAEYFSRSPWLDAGIVDLGNAFTLSTWANVSSGVSDIQCLWANGPGVANSSQVFFYVNDYKTDDGSLILTTGDGGSAEDQLEAPAGAVSLNQWHLLTAAVNRAGAAATLYVDGKQVAAGAAMSDFPVNNDLNFGSDTGDSFNFLGSLDEARINEGIESSNWVWASYMTVAANASFESYSAVVPPLIRIKIQNTNGNVVLTWPMGALQSATALTGPYATITDAASPYTLTPSATAQFFRVKVQ